MNSKLFKRLNSLTLTKAPFFCIFSAKIMENTSYYSKTLDHRNKINRVTLIPQKDCIQHKHKQMPLPTNTYNVARFIIHQVLH